MKSLTGHSQTVSVHLTVKKLVAMKPLALFILLALLSLQPIWAQSYHPFPDTNATWCDERYDNGWPESNYFYFYYKTDGKSTINDTVYTIISDNYDQVRCYLREENKKVFCRLTPDDPEFVLYYFDIDIGDTVILHQCYGESYTGFVESIDSLLIGNEYHKRYYIQCWEWLSFYFTEGVGSDAGLMYCDLPWVDFYGNLYCFSLNDTIYQADGSGEKSLGDCWDYIGIPENITEDIKVYPNPTAEYIFVNYDTDSRLELYDLSGRLCRQSQSKYMVVKDLEGGIYFLRVYSYRGNSFNEYKIIKLNAR
jgi:hypothetical protein